MTALASISIPLLEFLAEPNVSLPTIEALIYDVSRGALLATILFVLVDRRWQTSALVVAGVLLALIQFEMTYGLRLADPREFAWILAGQDGRWHHTSWLFFRHEPWQWPPGKITTMMVPVGTSIANTDSVPLPAFIGKLLDPWLAPDFQYFGLWFLGSQLLRGAFAGLIASQLRTGGGLALLALLLLIAGPGAAFSMDHAGRAGFSWLTLASLWLYFRRLRPGAPWSAVWPWLLLAASSALMNPYLCLVVIVFAAATLLRRWRPDRVLSAPQALLAFSGVLAVVLVCWWIAGYFELGELGQMNAAPLGIWSMDLLAFVNPDWPSPYLPTLPTQPSQFEGYNYLGAGVLVLLLCCVLLLVRRRPSRRALIAVLPLLLACAFFFFAALSPKITAAGHPIVDLPEWLFAPLRPFRASGRFGKPVVIAILVLALRLLVARSRALWAAPLLVLCVWMQLHESAPRRSTERLRFDQPSLYHWSAALDWDAWKEAAQGRREIRLVPGGRWNRDESVPFAYFAGRSGLLSAAGEPARLDPEAVSLAGQARQSEFERGILHADALYVAHTEDVAELRRHAGVTCRLLEGYEACLFSPTGEERPDPQPAAP